MPLIVWVGRAQAVPDAWRLTVSGNTAGTAYGFNGNERQIRYTAQTGNTVADVVTGIINAANNSTDQRVREMTVLAVDGDTTKLDVYGASNGRPVTSFGVTTGVASASLSTNNGKNHLSNVLNYSSGTLPVDGDVLLFTGGTADDGPMFALDALDGVELLKLERAPDFIGRIGLPDYSTTGYTEFRPKYGILSAETYLFRSNGNDTDGQFRIDADGAEAVIEAAGPIAAAGRYPLHIHNTAAGSVLYATGFGVSVAPEVGQVAELDAVSAVQGSALRLAVQATTGSVTIDASAADLDCEYASLFIRGAANVLGNVNAVCSTATGVACEVDDGVLDWRSTNKPAAEIVIGTGASLVTRNAVGPISGVTRIERHERSSFDDTTGRVAFGYDFDYYRCSPQNCTTLLPEHIKQTPSVL